MAFFNEAWFIHAVNDTVVQLAQQKTSKVRGAIRTREGVTGKTDPWQRIGDVAMQPIARDSDTEYINPPQSKRRAVLVDRAAAVLIDELDQVRMLTNPQSEFSQILAFARERELDNITLAKSATDLGGILGTATNVDEAGETTSQGSMLTTGGPLGVGQTIVNGGTGMTLSKLLDMKQIFDENNVEQSDRYMFYSPRAMRKLLTDTQVTSADYNTVKALAQGGFPADAQWLDMYWRMSTKLPKSGNIRSCIMLQKMGIGLSVGLIKSIEVSVAPHKWNNMQVIVKLTAGAVRVDDLAVGQIDIDESV
jgi:hypothetical protein